MLKLKHFLIVFLMIQLSLSARVLLITCSYNRPEFIEMQHKTFNKFLHDEFEFVIFNDASDDNMCFAINDVCQKLKLKCFRVPQKIHVNRQTISQRCADVIKYSLDTLGFNHDDKVMIIDSDMFLIKDFNFKKFFDGHAIAGVQQVRGSVTYLWNGLVFFDMNELPNKYKINFNCGMVANEMTDTGGYLYYYFQENPLVKPLYIDCHHIKQLLCEDCNATEQISCKHNTELLKSFGFNQMSIDLVQSGLHNAEFLLSGAFLHYRGGTNWDGQSLDYHIKKAETLNKFINEILDK